MQNRYFFGLFSKKDSYGSTIAKASMVGAVLANVTVMGLSVVEFIKQGCINFDHNNSTSLINNSTFTDEGCKDSMIAFGVSLVPTILGGIAGAISKGVVNCLNNKKTDYTSLNDTEQGGDLISTNLTPKQF